jgi:hypothetical protein
MKTLKITLILAVLIVALTSCTKQDLNEDDVLVAPNSQETLFTGGQVND